MNLMSKYSLKFKYQKLEEEYLQQRQSTLKLPVFKTGSACIFIVAMYKMIQMMLAQDLQFIPLMLAGQVFTVVSIVLLRFEIHKVNLQLIILAYFFMCYEIVIKWNTSSEALNLYLGNFAYCQIIIILISEYVDSQIIISTSFLFKLIYTIATDNKKSYPTYITTFVLMFFLSYFSYKINYQSRLNFLLSQQDYMWESMFPRILDKPYLIFRFNKEKIEFNFKSAHNLGFECKNNKQLKEFQREWKHQQNSLELTLFQCFVSEHNSDFFTRQIEIYNSKKEKLYIKFTILKAISLSVILSIEENLKKQEEFLSKTLKISVKQEKILHSLLKFVYKNLQVQLRNSNYLQIISLRKKIFLIILNQRIKNCQNKLVQFIPQCLFVFQDLFSDKNIKIKYRQMNDTQPGIMKAHFQRLFFAICKCAKKESTITVFFDQFFIITYQGKAIKYKKYPQLEYVWNSLVERQDAFSDQITIFLNTEPNIRFI